MLPESQLDRFLMRLALGIPDRSAERMILRGADRREMLRAMKPVMAWTEFDALQQMARQIHVSGPLLDYVQNLLAASRGSLQGLSPRGGIALLAAAKAWALIAGRIMVLPEDVQAVAVAVMGHRISGGSSHAELLVEEVPIP
jgi:MoxR-like ATPase